MTNYEKRVAEGLLELMNGLDWAFLGAFVEDVLDEKTLIDNEILRLSEEMKDEIEHYYRDDLEKFLKFNTIIKKFKENG